MPCFCGVETEQLRASGRRTEHAAGRRDVPAASVVCWRNRITEPAFDLDTKHESMKQICPGRASLLCQCKERRSNRRARMDHRSKVRIIEVKKVRADRIEKGCIENIETLMPTEDGGPRRTSDGSKELDEEFEVGMMRSSQ